MNVDDTADGATLWAVCNDDKAVQLCLWEQVAQLEAAVLVWNRRHPRQQPLTKPSPRTILLHQDPHVATDPPPHTGSGTAPPLSIGPSPSAPISKKHVRMPTPPPSRSSLPSPPAQLSPVAAQSRKLSSASKPPSGSANVEPTSSSQVPAMSMTTNNASVDATCVPTTSNASSAAAAADGEHLTATSQRPNPIRLLRKVPQSTMTACVGAVHGAMVSSTAAITNKASAAAAEPRTGKDPGAVAAKALVKRKAPGAAAAKSPRKAATGTAGGQRSSFFFLHA